MKLHWLVVVLTPLAALIVAWIGIARDAREQTVFLERVADTIEHTRTIPQETEQAIQKTIASVRRRATPASEKLEIRQRVAIDRIETALSSKEVARTSGIVAREFPRLPSE
jgi:hypothetical protein